MRCCLMLCLIMTLTGSTIGQQSSPVPLTLLIAHESELSGWKTLVTGFEKSHPDIPVAISTSAVYATRLRTLLDGIDAPDLFACPPFDQTIYQNNQAVNLTPLAGLTGLDHYDTFARLPWQSQEDPNVLYCLPVASIAYGFAYNADYFDVHGLTPPATYQDMLSLLQRIHDFRDIPPLAVGLQSQDSLTRLLYDAVGANHWNGEIGRRRLVDGTLNYESPQFLDTFATLSSWTPYLQPDAAYATYADAQKTFLSGQAAILPVNSLLSPVLDGTSFKTDIFHAPLVSGGDPCWLETEPLPGIGLNARSQKTAQALALLNYLSTPEFATLYEHTFPGQHALNGRVTLNITTQSLVGRFNAFRNICQPTFPAEITSTNIISLPSQATVGSNLAQLLKGDMSPYAIANELDNWQKR